MESTEEFRFSSGRLCLDLPATIRKRLSRPFDVLSSPGATARWLQKSRLVDCLLQLTEAQLNRVDALRWAISESADAASRGVTLPRAAVDTLNAAAALPLAVPRLNARTGGSKFVAEDPFESALATIARDAIDLVAGPAKSRIRGLRARRLQDALPRRVAKRTSALVLDGSLRQPSQGTSVPEP
jgi:predicted RNA-binding Zn ribbon-like protein